MGKLRKVVFLLFVILYFVVAPLTVLYALGYIFSPVQQTLLPTGLVSLNSEPPKAAVWINNSPVQDKTPVVLRNLEPKSYDLRVALPGFHPWRKRIEVRPDRALRFENILLFPLQLDPEVLGELPLQKLWSVPGGKGFLVLQGETASGLSFFEPEKGLFQPIFTRPRDQGAKINEVYLHLTGERAVVLLETKEGLRPIFVKLTEPVQTQDLTDLFPEPFETLQWGASLKESLFYLKEGTLKRVDAERGIFYPSLAKGVRGFASYGRYLFVLDARGRFLKLTEKGKIWEALLESPAKASLIFGPVLDSSYSIYLLKSSLALFLSESGRLLSNKLPYFLDDNVETLVPAVSHPRVLYRKGKELWVVDFEREREKSFFESGPTPRKIYRGKGELGNFFWFYDDRYLLFTEGNRLLVQDFEGEGNPIELLKISEHAPEVFLDVRTGFLYFAHSETNRLAQVKLFEGGWLLPRLVDDFMSAEKESP